MKKIIKWVIIILITIVIGFLIIFNYLYFTSPPCIGCWSPKCSIAQDCVLDKEKNIYHCKYEDYDGKLKDVDCEVPD